ncbi:MAG: UvrD-helicase domain-containing protein [Armatimonadota bacterium]|nr:UvrD-helicase domain-containing protein [Armatimonadota bacterium]MCX7777761.1 UvrD-helicase domain-containing protein [Armatimonadota bacterium]MDW8025418.1 UvrD-helicase domain-containing protein [Armatimonadota bacterium]
MHIRLSPLLEQLDEQQREAVLVTDCPVIVFAGAGSGKTRVLTYRVAYLVSCRGVPPSFIMAVTFTNKAANEMRERLVRLVGRACEQMWIGTFHAICARMLRMHGNFVGLKPNFVIFDEDDQIALIKRIMRELEIGFDRYNPSAIQAAISEAKVSMFSCEDYAEAAQTPFSKVVAAVYEQYERALRSSNAVDFDDLLLYALRMIWENESLLRYYSERFQYIHVDEYQDVNYLQHELVCALAKRHCNLFVVGDDDQAIYGWRKASVKFILELKERFPEARVVTLERNYRSTGVILEAAHHVIKNNRYRHKKRLWTTREGGFPVIVYEASDEDKEALFVANMIRELISQDERRYCDIAVMYRVNAQSRPFEEAFLHFGIPHRVVGAVRFYERREIKDMLAFMRLIVNPDDEVSLLRVINLPPRGIGDVTLRKLRTEAQSKGLSLGRLIIEGDKISSLTTRQLEAVLNFRRLVIGWRMKMREVSIPQLIQHILEESGYEEMLKLEGELQALERLANIEQLMMAAKRTFGSDPASQTLQSFLEQIALLTPQDETSWDGDAVTLLTVHSAKGLEFPVVFVVGLEEGLFPHIRSMNTDEEFEEERRLFYVALTRAKDLVILTYASKRMRRSIDGYWHCAQKPSRFIDEIPSQLKQWVYGEPTLRGFIRTFQPTAVMHPWQSVAFNIRALLDGHKGKERAESEKGMTARTPDEGCESETLIELEPGDRVFHTKFGTGTVRMVERIGRRMQAYVLFDDPAVGEKCLALEYAPLRKIE